MALPIRLNGQNIDASWFNDIRSEIQGGSTSVKTITFADSPYQAAGTDGLLLVDSTDGNVTVTPPLVAEFLGDKLTVVKIIAANSVIVTGVRTITIIDEAFQFSSDGTNFVILNDYLPTAVTASSTTTLTNKSIDSTNNTITNIVNADIKSDAAIVESKLDLDHSTLSLDGRLDSLELIDHTQNTDTGTNSNSFAIGDGLDSTKRIIAQNADGSKPKMRYNHTLNIWEFANDGATFNPMYKETFIETSTTPTTMTTVDGVTIVSVTTGASNKSVFLPTAASPTSKGRIIKITKKDSGTGHVVIHGSGYNMRGTTLDIYVIHPGETITLLGGTSEWILLSNPIRTVRGRVALGGSPTIVSNPGNWMSGIVANPGAGESRITVSTGVFSSTPEAFASGTQNFPVAGSGLVIASAVSNSATQVDMRQILQNGASTLAYAGVNTSITVIGAL